MAQHHTFDLCLHIQGLMGPLNGLFHPIRNLEIADATAGTHQFQASANISGYDA